MKGHYCLETINVDRPKERAYIFIESLDILRGETLEYYLDDYLHVVGPTRKKSKIEETILMMTPKQFREANFKDEEQHKSIAANVLKQKQSDAMASVNKLAKKTFSRFEEGAD